MSGYEASLFVTPVDQDLICGVCIGVVREPLNLPCPCGALYCKQCLVCLPDHRCPSCRSSFDPASCHVNKAIQKQIYGMTIKCEHHEKGCDVVFTVGAEDRNILAHKQVCLYEPVSCPDCSQFVTRHQLPAHSSGDCPMRKVTCDRCKCALPHRSMPQHVNNELKCSNLMYCPHKCVGQGVKLSGDANVVSVILKANEASHVERCPNRPIKCKVCSVEVALSEYDSHMQSAAAMHVEHLMSMIVSLSDRLRQQESSSAQKHEQSNCPFYLVSDQCVVDVYPPSADQIQWPKFNEHVSTIGNKDYYINQTKIKIRDKIKDGWADDESDEFFRPDRQLIEKLESEQVYTSTYLYQWNYTHTVQWSGYIVEFHFSGEFERVATGTSNPPPVDVFDPFTTTFVNEKVKSCKCFVKVVSGHFPIRLQIFGPYHGGMKTAQQLHSVDNFFPSKGSSLQLPFRSPDLYSDTGYIRYILRRLPLWN